MTFHSAGKPSLNLWLIAFQDIFLERTLKTQPHISICISMCWLHCTNSVSTLDKKGECSDKVFSNIRYLIFFSHTYYTSSVDEWVRVTMVIRFQEFLIQRHTSNSDPVPHLLSMNLQMWLMQVTYAVVNWQLWGRRVSWLVKCPDIRGWKLVHRLTFKTAKDDLINFQDVLIREVLDLSYFKFCYLIGQ